MDSTKSKAATCRRRVAGLSFILNLSCKNRRTTSGDALNVSREFCEHHLWKAIHVLLYIHIVESHLDTKRVDTTSSDRPKTNSWPIQ